MMSLTFAEGAVGTESWARFGEGHTRGAGDTVADLMGSIGASRDDRPIGRTGAGTSPLSDAVAGPFAAAD